MHYHLDTENGNNMAEYAKSFNKIYRDGYCGK